MINLGGAATRSGISGPVLDRPCLACPIGYLGGIDRAAHCTALRRRANG
jgi:hypothetical protein